jgi:hypothetical protein
MWHLKPAEVCLKITIKKTLSIKSNMGVRVGRGDIQSE